MQHGKYIFLKKVFDFLMKIWYNINRKLGGV